MQKRKEGKILFPFHFFINIALKIKRENTFHVPANKPHLQLNRNSRLVFRANLNTITKNIMIILPCRNTSKYVSRERNKYKKKKEEKKRERWEKRKKGDANILFASTRSGLKRLTARTGNVSERMQWAASRETLQELCVGLHYRRPELSTQPRDLAYQTLEWGRTRRIRD